MISGSILIALAIFIVVVLYVARPILQPAPPPAPPPPDRDELLARKEEVLEQIRLLDFDQQTGKVPEDIYREQRAELLPQAAAILQQLDNFEAGSLVTSEVEAAIAQLRQQPRQANGQGSFCTRCGQPLDAGDNYCAACGQPVKHALASSEPA